MFFQSVDGGATKTLSAIYDDNFNIYGVGVGGSSNFRNVGLSNFKRNLTRAVKEAEIKSGNIKVSKITFALAGIKDSEASTKLISELVGRIIKSENLEFYNDGEAGFFSRFPEDDGIIVAPGTGMVSYGKVNDRVERSSGWGWLLDDEGGAFYIGRRALQEIVKIMDRRNKMDTDLITIIKDYFSIENDRDIINKIYKNKIDIREIATVASLVSKEAKNKDELANQLMTEAAVETAKAAFATFIKLGYPENITISGYGGVLRSGEWYWDMIKTEMNKMGYKFRFKEPFFGYEAIIGSIIMTYKKLNISVDDNDITRLRNRLDKLIADTLTPEEKKKYLFIE